MSLAEYISLITEQRADGDALTYTVAPWFQLPPADQSTALDRLVEWSQAGDAAAVGTLGLLGDARAVPVLEAIAAAPGASRPSAAYHLQGAARRALFQIRGAPGDVAAVADELRADNELDRTNAAVAVLQSVQAPLGDDRRKALAVPLIGAALFDPAKPPRHHAGRAVAAVLGVAPDALPRQDPFAVLLFALSSGLTTQWQPAARELEAMLATRARPETYVPSADASVATAFWEALRPPVPRPEGWSPFRWDLVAKMGAHDRRWVETLVISRLSTGDTFAPAAAVRLLGAGAAPHLDAAERLHADNPGFVEAVALARRLLVD